MSTNELQTLNEKFPLLEYNASKGVLFGYIEIDDHDNYEVEIDISNFPINFPKVIETSGRIPRKADRHVRLDNTLCLTTPTMEALLLHTKIKSLEDFLDLILLPYLINNSYYEINGEYKFGEYSHCGIESAYQSYQDILGIHSDEAVAHFLGLTISGKKYQPNSLCFCGSNQKIKKCGRHGSLLQRFQSMYRNGSLKNDILVHGCEIIGKSIDIYFYNMFSIIQSRERMIKTVNSIDNKFQLLN